ncbi:Spc7 kinetochore protein-domain-containing protein [Pisolithus thermaeus]|nr:Spc7 kinetochore protein-domain-containing protein [Pisolithus croceorrhizus]KAI6152874.1 Spc7 kinetochore protein-domain-containing protein [Pisolithus thermaeus]
MGVNKVSPNRRNSISVTSHNRAHHGHRRRAHSIAPGDHLSPTARARRSLAPRKSILKAAANTTDDGEDRTQAMDMTSIVRFEADNSRKSLGRRVSFANHAHVRLFEVPEQNTNSTASPQSSPAAEIGSHGGANDENAYPGAAGFRRHSSMWRSVAFSEAGGEESMDMDSDDTGYSPDAFFRASNTQEVAEGTQDFGLEDEEDYGDGADMDVTEAVSHNILRKRSLSLGGPREPLGNLTIARASLDNQTEDEQGQHKEQSFVEEDSAQSHSLGSEGDTSQPMEFTVPLVRPAAPPSEAWLALRAVTHSGNTPFIPSSDDEENGGDGGVRDMKLSDAVSRLRAARASMGPENPDGEDGQPDSFTSTEDSFAEENSRNDDEGNQTINVTQLIRRISLAPSTGDSTMEVTSVYGEQGEASTSKIPSPTPATDSLEVPQQTHANAAKPSFSTGTESEPPTLAEPRNIPAAPQKFSFIPRPRTPATAVRPLSPSKADSLLPSPKKFTANFAPPASRPVPEKRSATAAQIPDGRSSPAKKPSGPQKLTAGLTHHDLPQPSSASSKLSPSKPARPQAKQGTQSEAGLGKRASLGLRRPSGYLARRKSFGGTGTSVSADNANQSSRPSSPNKQAMGTRRKSIAVARDVEGVQPQLELSADKGGTGRDRVALDPSATGDTVEPAEQTETQATPSPEPHETSVNESSHDDPSGEPSRLLSSQQVLAEDSMPDVAEGMGDDADDEVPQNSLPIGEPTTDATEQWREDVQRAGSEGEEGPLISIEQFFEMTGIRFMDEIAAPRRQSIHPSVLRPSRRASVEGQIPLAEYMVAMAVDVPQLELYTYVSKDLQAWIERIQAIYREAEEEALKMTPQLFQEFVSADEIGQAELIHQLKLIKVHNHEQAKSEWYDWKLQWVERLYEKASKGFEYLEKDANFLEGIIREAQSILPGLQQEYDQLVGELEQETAEIAELEACDQDYLKELKASIAEQGAELENYRREVEEAKAKLGRIEEKLKEVQTEKNEVSASIEKTERLINVQKNSTHAEVFRLKGELEMLQSLHVVQIIKAQAERFEFVYGSSYVVSTRCVECRPVIGSVQIQKLPEAQREEHFPAFSNLVLRTARELINRPEVSDSLRKIVEFVGTYWSSCSRLQLQFRLVAIKFPVTFRDIPSGFSADVTILYPSVKAKAVVSFIFDVANFSTWPLNIQSTKHDARVVYGPIQRDALLQAVGSRLKDVTPTNNHGCLLDACMEAAESVV